MSTERVAVARLLHRLGLGPTGTQYEQAVTIGAAGTAGELLLAVNEIAAAHDMSQTPPPAFASISLMSSGSRAAFEQARRDQERELKLWWLDRLATTTQPLLERATWYWHGHWATSEIKVRDCRFMLAQNQLLRATALGGFREQAKGMLKDPALLIWLDGKGNRKGHPNENLGREFLELFALGDGNYTESDVREASRALTGWQVDFLNGKSMLVPEIHDAGTKTVLGTTAAFDVDGLVDHITAQPACPRHIAQRWWHHFIASIPPTEAQLVPLVNAFGAERSSAPLAAAVAATLQDTSMTLPLAKAPVDWAVGVLRVLGTSPSELPRAAQNGLLSDLTAMGQQPFFPPNVSGWPSGRAWFTTTSAQARLRCSNRLIPSAPRWLRTVRRPARAQVLADRLGVPEWSRPTQSALTDGAISARDALIVALNSPDYLVGV